MPSERQLNLIGDFEAAERALKQVSDKPESINEKEAVSDEANMLTEKAEISESAADIALQEMFAKIEEAKKKTRPDEKEILEAEERARAYWEKVHKTQVNLIPRHPKKIEQDPPLGKLASRAIGRPVAPTSEIRNNQVSSDSESKVVPLTKYERRVKDDAEHDRPSFDLYERFNSGGK